MFYAALGSENRTLSLSKGMVSWCSFKVWTVLTLRLAQKGQPLGTSRRDVAVPGPSQVTREKGFPLTRLVHNTRCCRLSKALCPSSSAAHKTQHLVYILP
jgi:hypothetical protein